MFDVFLTKVPPRLYLPSSSSVSSYLQAGRLADVLALIQVLAYDKHSYRSADGLRSEFQGDPNSALTWIEIAKQHPEFFRVRHNENMNKGKIKRTALLARYVLDRVQDTDESLRRPALDISSVNKLMELAIALHDKQQERSDRWKSFIPIIAAIVGATAVVVVAILKS